MEKVTCPHGCKVLLVKDKKTGALKCPKCKCVFRVTLCHWDTKCFAKHHPDYGKVEDKPRKGKKRGRKRRKKKV